MEKAMILKIMANAESFKKGMNQANSHLLSFRKSVMQFKSMFAAAFSVYALKSFITTSVSAYKVQEQAEAKLLQAMNGRMDAMERLKEEASRLQRITVFGDEKTIEAQASLAMMIGDNENAIKRLMPLIQDMATGLKMDLTAAAQLVGKTLASSTNALSRYGIQVTGAVGSSDRLNSAVDSLTEKFKGQAEAVGETLTGRIEILQNAVSDLKEEVGRFILEGTAPMISGLVDMFTVLNEDNLSKLEKFYYLLAPKGDKNLISDYIKNYRKAIDEGMEAARELNAMLRPDDGVKVEKKGALTELREELKKQIELRETLSYSELAAANIEIEKIREKIRAYEQLGNELKDVKDIIIDFPESIAQRGGFDPFADLDFDMEAEFFPKEDRLDDALIAWGNKIEDFSQAINNIVKSAFTDVAVEIAESIGSALVGGDIDNLFQNIMSKLGSYFTQLGAMFMAYGIAELAFWDSWSKGPAGALQLIAAGAALAAIGGGIKALASAKHGSYGGDVVSRQVVSGQNITVQGKLSGKDIYLSGSRYIESNSGNT